MNRPLANNLVQADASAQGWLADEAKLRQILELSMTREQRQAAETWLQFWEKQPWQIRAPRAALRLSWNQHGFHR